MFGHERHSNLAAALPVAGDAAVVDLGCGDGQTLTALDSRADAPNRLVGVDNKSRVLPGDRFECVVADLNERLPFEDNSFAGAISHNVIEQLADPQAFINETDRILLPGGYLLLGHSDFDTIVFSSSDLPLTRHLVHHFCDTVQPFMTVADGAVGRRLLALGRRSPMEVIDTFAWIGHHTSFEAGGPAHTAASLIAKDGWRDPETRDQVDGWLADLDAQAQRGELFYSINDYAVLLRKRAYDTAPER